MGMFDSFLDSTGAEHQTKAFGKTLGVRRLGDTVAVRRAPVTEADYAAWMARSWDETPEAGAETCQVRASGDNAHVDSYIDVVDGVFVGISTRRNRQVPLFDYFGHLVHEHLKPVPDLTEPS